MTDNLLEGLEALDPPAKKPPGRPKGHTKESAPAGYAVGRHATYFRMSLTQAAMEFGYDIRTLDKKLRALGIMSDPIDNKFSINQICAAKFGDKEREQTRNIQEQADKHAMDNEKERRKLIPTALVLSLFYTVGVTLRDYILASELDAHTKEDSIKHINESLLDPKGILSALGFEHGEVKTYLEDNNGL